VKLLLDFSAGLPSPEAIIAGGFSGVVAYIKKNPSGGSTGVHGITGDYYRSLIAAGLEVNLVYEAVDRLRPFLGYNAGKADGDWVKSQLAAEGIPARNVFMAHDIWETYTQEQIQASRDYQRGAHDSLGDVAGAYAFAWFLKIVQADRTAGKLWLTGSPSSKFDGLHLYQRNYGQINAGGIMCDVNEVLADDHGQLPAPKGASKPPTKTGDEFDMASIDDLKAAVKAVMDSEREDYARRTTSYVRANGLVAAENSLKSFHNEYHGSRMVQGDELKHLVDALDALGKDVDDIKSHLGIK
jgi:hypothetical protein